MHTIGEYLEAQERTRRCAAGTMFSPPEVELALALKRRGLWFDQQVFVGTRILDFLVEGKLCVEVDGKAFHHPVKDFVRDCELKDHQFVTLRIPAGKVMHDPDGAVCMVANKLFELRNLCVGVVRA